MLQKVQQAWQLLNVLVIPWLSDSRSELVVFFSVYDIWGLDLLQGQVVFVFSKSPDWLPPACSMGVELFALYQSGQGVNLTTYLCLVLRFKSQWSYVGTIPVYVNGMDKENSWDIHSSGMIHGIDW